MIDVKGKVVHAAFIDPHVPTDRLAGKGPKRPKDDDESAGSSSGSAKRATGPASHPVAAVRAEDRAIDALVVKDDVADTYRRMGFAVVNAAPSAGVLRGSGAVVSLADGPISGRILETTSGQYVSLEPESSDDDDGTYPVSKMGAVAVTRQAFLDANWWREAEAAYAASPSGRARPRYRAATAALVPAAQGKDVVVFEAIDVLALLRAAKIAKEMKLKARYVGAGDEYRLLSEVSAVQPDLVLRVNFPQPDKPGVEEEWLDVPVSRLRAFDSAPSNPKWLHDAGLSVLALSRHHPEEEANTKLMRTVTNTPRVLAAARRARAAGSAMTTRLVCVLQRGGVDSIEAIDRYVGWAAAEGADDVCFKELYVSTSHESVYHSRDANRWSSEHQVPLSLVLAWASSRGLSETHRLPWGAPIFEGHSTAARSIAAPPSGPRPAGHLENADMVAANGKVVAVGKGLRSRAGAVEIDGKGAPRPASSTVIRTPPSTATSTRARTTSRRMCGSRTSSTRSRRRLPRARGRDNRRQRPPRLGQRDRRPERDREVEVGGAP